jgi:pyruvate formate lyase activating enzyme
MMNVSRRYFLSTLARGGALACGAGSLALGPDWLARLWMGEALAKDGLPELLRNAPRARFWISSAMPRVTCDMCHAPGSDHVQDPEHVHAPAVVRCRLCARRCTLEDGERGMCQARINVGGELRTLVYGRPMAVHVDPIEKKPFYHFVPGARAYSLATSGCPLRCQFCQNWQLSQARPEDYQTETKPPARIVDSAVSRRAPIIAFTYNEPTVFIEYLTDIARAASKKGVRSVLISCGYMNEAPLAEMCDVLSAIKFDLKGINPKFYRDVCGAELAPVLRSIRQVAQRGVHLEIVNLVVSTLNDADVDLKNLASWLAGEIGPDVPVHFTRFHPDYRLQNLPPTPVATLERARQWALDAGLRYAFVGNVPGHPGNHTYCPRCKKVIIERHGFFVAKNLISQGRCSLCGEPIAGVWS